MLLISTHKLLVPQVCVSNNMIEQMTICLKSVVQHGYLERERKKRTVI
jgi:hypothetical protein